MSIEELIRDVPDFPREGIIFKDITPVLKDKDAFAEAVKLMAEPFKKLEIDYVIGIEARGFIFGTPLAVELNAGFIPVRKPGKLPCAVIKRKYELEYGSSVLEMHRDALEEGDRVLIVDDLLATGGTVAAVAEMVEELGGDIGGFSFLIELAFLKGREQLQGYEVHSVITVE